MRKLKLQMQITLDGFNSTGPNDDQKWVTWAWEEIKNYALELANSCDTELLGRKLAVDYIPFWNETLLQPESPFYEVAKIKSNQRKIVFTKTLETSLWDKTELAKGDLKDEINKLKSEQGKDIIVYGGSSFVGSLIKEELIDEFHFFMNPIAIGKGVSAFEQLKNWQQFDLKKSIHCDSGIIILHYSKK